MLANFPEASLNLSLDVQPLLLSVFCPLLFQCTGLLPRRDPESGQRQNQRTHANVGFSPRARHSTTAAGDDRCSEISAGPNSVKRSVQFVS
jgi:hypothetical protein